MSAFTDHLAISPAPGGRWQLDAPLAWEIGRKGSGLVFTVPAGFVTDLASIPALVRWWLNPADARFAKASILHDAMLADPEFSRATASAEFHGALLANGVTRLKAVIMASVVLVWTVARSRMPRHIGQTSKTG